VACEEECQKMQDHAQNDLGQDTRAFNESFFTKVRTHGLETQKSHIG